MIVILGFSLSTVAQDTSKIPMGQFTKEKIKMIKPSGLSCEVDRFNGVLWIKAKPIQLFPTDFAEALSAGKYNAQIQFYFSLSEDNTVNNMRM